MKKEIPFLLTVILAATFITSCSLNRQSVTPKSLSPSFKANTPPANCGPKVLLEICKFYNISATEEELTILSDTKNGESSFFGLSQAVTSKGLKCLGAKVSFDRLKELTKDNQIIVHFSENHHFILIKEIKDKTVTIYDPALTNMTLPRIPIHLFLSDWDGNVLIINKELQRISTHDIKKGG